MNKKIKKNTYYKPFIKTKYVSLLLCKYQSYRKLGNVLKKKRLESSGESILLRLYVVIGLYMSKG